MYNIALWEHFLWSTNVEFDVGMKLFLQLLNPTSFDPHFEGKGPLQDDMFQFPLKRTASRFLRSTIPL